ncbi:MAG: NAD(P)/FAD-dependent oxidoreductase [Nocardioidaceae bacterium]
MRGVTDRRGLRPWIDFGVEVTGAAWDESRRRWTVQTAGGQAYEARVVVSGIGALHVPGFPTSPALETFAGPAFHSAQWRHGIDLTGKHVAVIGTGASAIQFIPVIAGQVAQLDVYQRTAPWVIPKNDKCVEGWKKSLFDKVPGALRAYRNGVYWTLESTAFAFTGRFKGIGSVSWRSRSVLRGEARSMTPRPRAS